MGRIILLSLIAACVATPFLSRGTQSGELPAPKPDAVAEPEADVEVPGIALGQVNSQVDAAQMELGYHSVFLALLDMDMNVGAAEAAAEDYRQLLGRAVERFPSNSPGEIVDAVLYVHNSNTYYPNLTGRDCLTYLIGMISPGADATLDRGAGPADVRTAANEIHDSLFGKFLQPQEDEMERQYQEKQALGQRIDQNLAAARQRGAAANRARAEAILSRYDPVRECGTGGNCGFR